MRISLIAPLLLLATAGHGQINVGSQPGSTDLPFTITPVADFKNPWKLAFLQRGMMILTDKSGEIWLVAPDGAKRPVSGVPAVAYKGQGGLLGVFTAPTYARDHGLYITYSEPGPGGSGLALAHAVLEDKGGQARLANLKVIWRQLPRGTGGQFGGYVAFAPDGKSLFLSAGERQRFTPAQDPNQAIGKILHLTLDGKPSPDNPMAGKTGDTTVTVTDPPKDTEVAKGVAGRTETMPSPNLTPSETWTMGNRNPYGLAFDRAGRLWETEMGPRGGDELNLIEKGANYGWPIVSYGMNYDRVPIADPKSHPEFKEPILYWNPVISPAGFTFYEGKMFPVWRGSAFIGGMSSQSLTRITFDGTSARPADRWSLGFRVRDVMVSPDDGAIWLVADGEFGSKGRLVRLTPK